ncbi:MAG: methyl-accepting chemotaxis protein [Acetobacteraceae bacterium]|nr:MAG: methyl-accepting chemotaxis protein [Acetobacteraceae bacterium]
MRPFRDLSVGRKLAASVILAVLLLGGMVWMVSLNLNIVQDQQMAERAAVAAQLAAQRGATHVGRTATALREVLMSQTDNAANDHGGRMLTEAQASKVALEAALALAPTPAIRDRLAQALQALEEYGTSAQEQAGLRKQLINERDETFARTSSDYDQAYEAVSSMMELDVPPEAREDARQRLAVFHAAVNEVRLGAQRFLATGEEGQARRVRRAAAQLRVHQRAVGSIPVAPTATSDLRRITAIAADLAQSASRVVQLAEAAIMARTQRSTPARERLETSVNEVQALLTSEATARAAASAASGEALEESVLWIGGAVALLLVLSGWINARAIGTPLRRLVGTIRAIASGDADVTVPDQGRKDEIGSIAEALEDLRGTVQRAFAQQQMLEQMPIAVMTADPNNEFRVTSMNPASQALLGSIEHLLPCSVDSMPGQSIDILHRNPSHQRAILSDPQRLPHKSRIRLGDEVIDLAISAIRDANGAYVSTMLVWSMATAQARLADQFEADIGGVVQAVASAAAQVQDAAQALTGTAATSDREAEAVAEAGNRAGADVQAVAASAEELATSVAEISRQVAEGATVARAAAAEARATDETVQGLALAAQKIGDVVRLIGDIAGQTNLLALNATIEAARAGEAGKGFAVVASEVKALAGQTAKATEEISTQIGAIQSATGNAVTALRSIGGTIERINEVTTAIAAAVEQQGSATQEIARSATQVAEGTSAVALRIQDVQRAARETGEASAGLLGAAEGLSGYAGTLRDRAGSFLVNIRRA